MARGNPVEVMGIWLRRDGDHVIVSAETKDGKDVVLIREWLDSQFSHNISEHGIKRLFDDAAGVPFSSILPRKEFNGGDIPPI